MTQTENLKCPRCSKPLSVHVEHAQLCEGCAAELAPRPPAQCRRCTECVGQDHHWMENGRAAEPGDPYFICKHCDAACNESDPEEGFPEPSGVLVEQPPICDDCDEYVHACDCEPDNAADHSSEGSQLSDRCVLGEACCCPHIFHGPEECYSAEDAEAAMEPDSNATLGLTDQNTRFK